MRVFLKMGRQGRLGWLWPVALLTLPACGLETGGTCTTCGLNLDPGPAPQSNAVFCDIEKPSGRHCASDQEINLTGIRLTSGAIALVSGQSSNIGLDYSATATSHCGGGPEAVEFEGKFPEGLAVCVNCLVAPTAGTAASLCTAQCEDLTDPNHAPPDPGVAASCATRAHLSTNASDPTWCFGGACSSAGNFLDSFVDPRRHPEPVIWQNLIGVATSGSDSNTLTRSAPTTNAFDAGAASTQVIAQGDGYVEFTATEVNTARLGGLSVGGPPDTNPDYTNIDFAIDLFTDGCFYVFESGNKAAGPVQTCAQPNAFGAYNSGDKFRVYVSDNLDGTANVRYAHVTVSCMDGSACAEDGFYSSAVTAHYPLRVDSSFREQGGTLTNVRLVRIR